MKLIFLKTLIIFSTIKTAVLINRKKSKCIQTEASKTGLYSTWDEKNFNDYFANEKLLDISSEIVNS